jgi:hypothetical protein
LKRAFVEPDPKQPNGYALVRLPGAAAAAADPRFLIRREGYEKGVLGPGGWQVGEGHLSPLSANVDGEDLIIRLGPQVVDLLEPGTVLITVPAAAFDGFAVWPDIAPSYTGSRMGDSTPTSEGFARPAQTVGEQPSRSPASTETRHRPEGPGPPPGNQRAGPVKRTGGDGSMRRRSLALIIAIGLFGIVAGGTLVVFPQTRCAWFGISCPTPIQPTRDLLREALNCAAAKQSTAPCEVDACFRDYLSQTPAADVHPAAQRALDDGRAACQPPVPEPRQSEDYVLNQARQCATSAQPCVVKTCYADYLAQFPSGVHRPAVDTEIARAEQACRPTPSPDGPALDGRYLARTAVACGAKSDSIIVEINHGRITWRHEYQGISYPWEGTLDNSGAIQALVRGSTDLRASGRFDNDERQVRMIYPQCAAGVPMEIITKMSN